MIVRKMDRKSPIYVIDDAEWHNILVKNILGQGGYKVQTFTDGAVLLKSLERDRPQMIISDINMPSINGFELCERVRQVPGCENIPLVYVTSMAKDEVDQKLNSCKAVGMMQKPLEKQSFLNLVSGQM